MAVDTVFRNYLRNGLFSPVISGAGGAGQGGNKERRQPDYSGKAIFFRSSM